MPEEGARKGGKGVRTDRERGTMRMVWKRTRVVVTGEATEGRHGKGDGKMARKTAKDWVGRRECA